MLDYLVNRAFSWFQITTLGIVNARSIEYLLSYDGVGNVLESTDANGHTTKYGYDAVNRQNKVTDALGKVVSQKVYDAAGRVISSTNMYGVETTTSYDDAIHKMTMTNPLGSSYQWTDAFGNVTLTKASRVGIAHRPLLI
jgi:YD repeat-containing protein